MNYIFESNGGTIEPDEHIVDELFGCDVFEEILLDGIMRHSFLRLLDILLLATKYSIVWRNFLSTTD